MARNSVIPPESFDEILAWLNSDRDVAAQMYVQLRDDLEKIFKWSRCTDPQGLTDQVIDRVAKKVHVLRHTFTGDPRLFFYGVARNLVKEESKKIGVLVSLETDDVAVKQTAETHSDMWVIREECLEMCLQELSNDKRRLIVSYYDKDKQAKIDHRAEMAKELGITIEALRVKMHRIRTKVEQCIERCVDDNLDGR